MRAFTPGFEDAEFLDSKLSRSETTCILGGCYSIAEPMHGVLLRSQCIPGFRRSFAIS